MGCLGSFDSLGNEICREFFRGLLRAHRFNRPALAFGLEFRCPRGDGRRLQRLRRTCF